MANTWPGGYRHAMTQAEHEAWNAEHYPGTRQLCSECSQPAGRCEEDSLIVEDLGPLCRECYNQAMQEFINHQKEANDG